MKINEDEILEIITYLDIEDIKKICKSDKKIFDICKRNQKIIFKDIVYVLEYLEHDSSNVDTIKFDTFAVFKNKNDAIIEMDKKYNSKKEEFDKMSEANNSFSYSFGIETGNSRRLSEDNGNDNDMNYQWKIKTIKLKL